MASYAIYLYIASTIFFILGIKRLSKVRTARSGNTYASIGMLLAILGVLMQGNHLELEWLIPALVIGAALGHQLATRVAMTAMPELVAAFNGVGGAASAFVAAAELFSLKARFARGAELNESLGGNASLPVNMVELAPIIAITLPITVLIGMATLTGSGVAYFKLSGTNVKHPFGASARPAVHGLLILAIVAISAWLAYSAGASATIALLVLLALSAVAGHFLVTPIGGADMPVVVALLNSLSGVAAAASGFVIGNQLLIVAGALVGASGLILTQIMCKAMNRSLGNVLKGGVGDGEVAEDAREYSNIKETSPEEVAMLFDGATSVIFVPGYGLAVAQAQHVCAELASELEKRDVDVRYAIHPVAGRMPGHMNVLLAEADAPYEKLWELERINGDFQNTDVVVVLGANDVVNPAAREDANSPIAGMPILDVDFAATVVVVKRSLSPGYAGIKNPLFEKDNTLMVFMDAKQALQEMVDEVKDL
ncbi:MAG: NAD(P)(+) transhydrogenase (Re/Si-specific) subunit beta [Planctomycetota bacterium]